MSAPSTSAPEPARGQAAPPAPAGRGVVDFDLHGLVGIRLVGASAGDAAAVERQLGPIRAPLARDPDITIRFVEQLPLRGGMRYLGVGEAGFTDDSFIVTRGKLGTQVRARIPFEQLGGPCEITCETGLSAVPLLVAAVNLAMLGKGVLPLHAAALRYRDTGILATGWSKGGKTETLLAFSAHGAEYIGDEWVYVRADGSQMHGIPEPVRVWDWHIQELPALRAALPRGERARLAALRAAVGLGDKLPRKLRRAAQRPLRLLKRQLHADISPQRLFGAQRCATSSSFDRLIFVGSHDSPETVVRPMAPEEVARRMVFSLEYERMPLTDYYLRFRFAFPRLRNGLIEGAEETQRQLLLRALKGKPSHAVFHPYPVTAAAMYDAIAPLVRP